MVQASKKTIKSQEMTEDQKQEQILRFISQKRESFATGALFNMLQNPEYELTPSALAKEAVAIADAMMEELYPIGDGTQKQ